MHEIDELFRQHITFATAAMVYKKFGTISNSSGLD